MHWLNQRTVDSSCLESLVLLESRLRLLTNSRLTWYTRLVVLITNVISEHDYTEVICMLVTVLIPVLTVTYRDSFHFNAQRHS